MALVWVEPHQYLQISPAQLLLDNMGSIISNNIILRRVLSKTQATHLQISSINTEVWHQDRLRTSNILMGQAPVILLQATINLALLQIIEVFHLVHECQVHILLQTMP